MRIDYSDGSHLDFGTPEPGTAGTGDVVLLIEVSCQGFAGRSRGYFERAEFQAFAADLTTLLETGAGKAALFCDSAKHVLEISPVDALGHYVLQVSLSSTVRIGVHHYSAGCSAAFPLESSQLASLRALLTNQASSKV